jgi:hypothetical protein
MSTKNGARDVARNAACPCGSGLKFKRCCMEKGISQEGAHRSDRGHQNGGSEECLRLSNEGSESLSGLDVVQAHARLLDACYGREWRGDWRKSAAFRQHLRLYLKKSAALLSSLWPELAPALTAARAQANEVGGIDLPSQQSIQELDCRTVAMLTGFQGTSGKLDLGLVIAHHLQGAAMRTGGILPGKGEVEIRDALDLVRSGRWVVTRLVLTHGSEAHHSEVETFECLSEAIKSGMPTRLLSRNPGVSSRFSTRELKELEGVSQFLSSSLNEADNVKHYPLLTCASIDTHTGQDGSEPAPVSWGEDVAFGVRSLGPTTGAASLRFLVEACGVPLILCKDGLSELSTVAVDLLLACSAGTSELGESNRAGPLDLLTELLHPQREKRSTLNAVLFNTNKDGAPTVCDLAVLLDRIMSKIYDSGEANTGGRRAKAVVAKLMHENAESCPFFAYAVGSDRAYLPSLLAWGKALHQRFQQARIKDLFWSPISEADFCRALNPDLWKVYLAQKKGQKARVSGSGQAGRSWRVQRSFSWEGSMRSGTEAEQELPLQDTVRLCNRLQIFVDNQLQNRNMGIRVHVIPDLSDSAKVLFADLGSQTLRISRRALQCPWMSVQQLALAGVCHFVAQSYREQGVSQEKAYELAWKRMCLQASYRSRSVTWDEPPLDWFEREEALTDDERRFLQKINRLLALGQSTNEHEAALAIERAEELMRQRNIKAGAFSRGLAPDDLVEVFDRLTLYLGTSRLSTIVTKLVGILSRFYSVKVILLRVPQKLSSEDERAIMLLGRRESLLVAEHVFDYLHDQVERLWQSVQKAGKLKHADKLSYQLGLLNGFSRKMAEREAERIAKKKSPAEANQPEAQADDEQIIHLHQEELNDYQAQVFPRLTTLGVRRTNLRTGAFKEGIAEGSALDVKSAIGSTSGKGRSEQGLLTS